MRNEYVRSYDYHYADRSLPFAEWLVRWFAFTSWTFKFRVSLDNVLGENRLELMDRISLENFFFTRVPGAAKSSVDGFVVAINPDIYEGTAEIGIYVPEPPGIFGPNCDPFNNALEFPDRSAMPANDASSCPRTGEPYRTDAGIFPRVITC